MFSFQDKSLEGRVDLGTSSQVIIFRARYSSKFRSMPNCLEQRHRLPSKKKKINDEMKTGKVTKYIYSFGNI